jgi:hypothetical protein
MAAGGEAAEKEDVRHQVGTDRAVGLGGQAAVRKRSWSRPRRPARSSSVHVKYDRPGLREPSLDKLSGGLVGPGTTRA